MLNNTFRHLPSSSVKHVDLKCFSTFFQCAISKSRTRNGDTFRTIKTKRNCCDTNPVRVVHSFIIDYHELCYTYIKIILLKWRLQKAPFSIIEGTLCWSFFFFWDDFHKYRSRSCDCSTISCQVQSSKNQNVTTQ